MPLSSNFSSVSDIVKKSPFSSRSRLRYPLENKMEYPGRIIFRTIETIPPNTRGEGIKNFSKRFVNKSVDAFGTQVGQLQNLENVGEFIKGLAPFQNQSGSTKSTDLATKDDTSFSEGQNSIGTQSFRPTQTRIGNESVELYLPPGIQFNDALSYDEANLNIRGTFARTAVEGGSNMFSAAAQGVGAGAQGIMDLINGTGGAATEEAARAGIIRSLALAPGDDLRSGIRVALQTTLNPNVKSVFRNVVQRQFAFNFKFISTSRAESVVIEKIIKFFRKHAYPEHIPSGAGNETASMEDADFANNSFSNIPIGFTFPDKFKISMRVKNEQGKDVQFGYKIKPCVLRTVMTNFNSSGMSFHEDGKPFEVELNLNFQEFGTLSRRDIEKGF
tara:strand:- start:1714 stop:2877 length:1164 start_codon:yes stop_codon:yes gene_type:complete